MKARPSLPKKMTCDAPIPAPTKRWRAGRLPEVAQVWREVVALEPDRAESYHQLAVQLVALGLFREALYCSDRAIALAPEVAVFHCARGHALLRLYDGERAAASSRRTDFAYDRSDL